MSRPKCPVTETVRPNRPDRIGQTETAQMETAWPNRPDRKVVYPAMDPRIFGQRNEPRCNKHIASIETKFQSTQLYSADKTKM